MASIIYRTLDANGDPLRGQGASNFLADRNAVAQAILTRLRLLFGEWFENLNDGTPVFQQILGQRRGSDAISSILTERILGTPYVTGVTGVYASFDPKAGAFSFSCSAQTAFGTVTLSNLPGYAAANLP